MYKNPVLAVGVIINSSTVLPTNTDTERNTKTQIQKHKYKKNTNTKKHKYKVIVQPCEVNTHLVF